MRPESPDLNKQARSDANPEEAVSAEYGSAKDIIMFEVVNTGHELCGGAEKNGPGNDEGNTGCPGQLLRSGDKGDNGQAK